MGLRQIRQERARGINRGNAACRQAVARVIFLEGHPNLQTLDPFAIGQNIKEVLECDLKAEYSASELYREAHDACRDLGDIGSMELFKQLLQDEEGHIDFLETELGLLERLGIQNYGLPQAEAAGGKG